MAKERYDENGHLIGDGSFHCDYTIEKFENLPIKVQVQKSYTSESVYVIYINTETLEACRVRFSHHISNDVKFGAVIDGYLSNVRNEILYRLGFMTKTFVPSFANNVTAQYVAKKKLSQYEIADKTLEELKALPAGTDISEYKGKIAKGSTMVITCDKVKSVQRGGYFEYKMK